MSNVVYLITLKGQNQLLIRVTSDEYSDCLPFQYIVHHRNEDKSNEEQTVFLKIIVIGFRFVITKHFFFRFAIVLFLMDYRGSERYC